MIEAIGWFVPGVIGVTFTVVGCLKCYGLYRGIEGGAEKPFHQQLCGT